jgi:hypothetical protein
VAPNGSRLLGEIRFFTEQHRHRAASSSAQRWP